MGGRSGLALVCTALVMLAGVEAAYRAPFKEGSAKNAWPEYVGWKSAKAVEAIEASGLVKHVRVWAPSFQTSDTPPPEAPANRGTPQDVWIYTDQNDEVYEIPQRGVWHPNRVYPGWPNLVGTDYKYAVQTILKDFYGVTVRYVPEDALKTVKLAYTRNRVYVLVDKNGKVARTPLVF